MGYEHDMDDYYEEQREKEHMKRRYKIRYDVPAGSYESNSLFGLVWEVLKHRTWHLFKHGRWMD